jgi:hypothetical protein
VPRATRPGPRGSPPTTAAPGPATGGPPGRRARPRAGLRAGLTGPTGFHATGPACQAKSHRPIAFESSGASRSIAGRTAPERTTSATTRRLSHHPQKNAWAAAGGTGPCVSGTSTASSQPSSRPASVGQTDARAAAIWPASSTPRPVVSLRNWALVATPLSLHHGRHHFRHRDEHVVPGQRVPPRPGPPQFRPRPPARGIDLGTSRQS